VMELGIVGVRFDPHFVDDFEASGVSRRKAFGVLAGSFGSCLDDVIVISAQPQAERRILRQKKRWMAVAEVFVTKPALMKRDQYLRFS